ncbi:MAG: hypothetical protein EOO50_15965 [Flavobacterium sp.]|uniref:hypothetical protein n=1 Tax=Flavobacterium sp. TaxID=239 RepID=UPI001202BDE5|nr:hypothetical protein [Flavobacterium sp.]RZJ64346.1 MAG: hypothetical protein EOO50_15965 [Flavobacterium sp.]
MKIFKIAVVLFIGGIVSAQTSDIRMSSKGSFDKKELRDLMYFQNLDYYKIAITGTELKGKNYHIIAKEIWNGKIKKIDTIFNSRQLDIFRIAGDTLSFSVTSGKTTDKNLRVRFDFGRFALTENYKSTKSSDYSLRDSGSNMKIEIGKPFYAFAYILPAEHEDGSKSWCEVEADGNDIENWGRKFGIKHYLLFEMKFE